MSRAWTVLAALFILSPLAGPAVAQTPAPPSIVRANATEKVSAHVWTIPDANASLVPNVGIVVGAKAVLVVDTGLGPRNGRTILAEVARLAPGKRIYLVTTHFHPEHDLGAQAFPADTVLIRSKDQEADIAEFGLQLARVFADRSPLSAELLAGAAFRAADITFETERNLDLGGVKARIHAMGPNHTRGDTAVFVEPDGILFAGDVVMSALPAFASPYSSVSHWLASLDRLRALNPTLIVPSHGPNGGVELIEAYRRYLTAVRDRTAAAKRAGRSVEDTVAAVGAELRPTFPDPRDRLGGAIRAAYREAS